MLLVKKMLVTQVSKSIIALTITNNFSTIYMYDIVFKLFCQFLGSGRRQVKYTEAQQHVDDVIPKLAILILNTQRCSCLLVNALPTLRPVFDTEPPHTHTHLQLDEHVLVQASFLSATPVAVAYSHVNMNYIRHISTVKFWKNECTDRSSYMQGKVQAMNEMSLKNTYM